MKEKPRQVVSGSGVRLGRNYPKIAKKTPSIREVKEVRDDKAACPLIQLSQDKVSGSGATPTTLKRTGVNPVPTGSISM